MNVDTWAVARNRCRPIGFRDITALQHCGERVREATAEWPEGIAYPTLFEVQPDPNIILAWAASHDYRGYSSW